MGIQRISKRVKVLGLEATLPGTMFKPSLGKTPPTFPLLSIGTMATLGTRHRNIPTTASTKLFASAATLAKNGVHTSLGEPLPNKASCGSLCYLSPRCKGSGKSECEFPPRGGRTSNVRNFPNIGKVFNRSWDAKNCRRANLVGSSLGMRGRRV